MTPTPLTNCFNFFFYESVFNRNASDLRQTWKKFGK